MARSSLRHARFIRLLLRHTELLPLGMLRCQAGLLFVRLRIGEEELGVCIGVGVGVGVGSDIGGIDDVNTKRWL